MKVLALEGSPREGGNSSTLLDWVVEGIEEGGGEVTRLRVSCLDIHPCTGCDGCLSTGKCVIEDHMDLVMDLVFSHRHMVVATPVYFYHVPAQLKALVDRFQPLWVRKTLLGIPPRRRGYLVLVACGATRGKGLFDCILRTFRTLSPYLGLDFSPFNLLVPGVDRKGEVEGRRAIKGRARDLGWKMVSQGKHPDGLSPEDRGFF